MNYLVREIDGASRFLLEGGLGAILRELQAGLERLLQENGLRIGLEEGIGFLLLEESTEGQTPPFANVTIR